MKKIVSFGDSFVYGVELANNADGSRAWPAQVAHDLGVNYVTCAEPGCSNESITRQILSYFANNHKQDTLAIINWTWTHRWDFYLGQGKEQWATLGPMSVPHRYYNILDRLESQRVVDFAKDYGCASLLWNKVRSLQTIMVAQQYLKHLEIPNIQTFMDPDMLDTVIHAPDHVQQLQTIIEPELKTWEGHNFLDWSRMHGYAVSNPGLHPLEDAHQAAAALWRPTYARYLT